MNNYKPVVRCVALFLLAAVYVAGAFAQAPDISYSSPQNYKVNARIASLAPKNMGGAVLQNTAGKIEIFAGNGTIGYKDGPASGAIFRYPIGLAVDNHDNVFVADYDNNMIREITQSGTVTTFAGNGSVGSTDGPAKSASFNEPNSVAAVSNGGLYVCDFSNNKIRLITSNGNVSTIAGSAEVGNKDGVGAAATFNFPTGIIADLAGNIYVADKSNNLIRKITPSGLVSTIAGNNLAGFKDGMGTSASFYRPQNITIDRSGNLYVTDYSNHAIRKIDPAGNVTTIAGNGKPGTVNGTGRQASFNYPSGIVTDSFGNIYVTDFGDNTIRRIDASGNVTTFLSSANTSIPLGGLNGLSIDSKQFLYVADTYLGYILKIPTAGYTINKPLPAGLNFDSATGIISGTPTTTSPPTDYTITAYNASGSSSAVVNISVQESQAVAGQPPDISYQSPQVYFVNKPITPLRSQNKGGAVPANTYGLVTTFAGNGSGGNNNAGLLTSGFSEPAGLVFDTQGNLYISETGANDIRKITPAGVVSTFAGTGKAADINGNAQSAAFNSPGQIVFDASGNMLIADEGNNVIRKISTTGIVSTLAGTGISGRTDGPEASATFNSPVGIAIDPSGVTYIADLGNSTVRKIDLAGNVSTLDVLGSGTAPLAAHQGLGYLATDAAGKLSLVYSNQLEQIVQGNIVNSVAGAITPGYADGVGGAARFYGLVGVAIDAGGDAYIADNGNNLIRRVGADRKATTVAGGPGSGLSDGISSAAKFNGPVGVAIDPTGDFLYIADAGNNLIRKVGITGYSIDRTLPTGLTFDPATGIISGTPVFATGPQTYVVTAYNKWGSSSSSIVIQIDDASVTFGPIPAKTVCDPDFDPGAKGSGQITYTSSNAAVATIVSGQVHITGAGTTTITASDGTSQVNQTLTVNAAVTPSVTITPQTANGCQDAAVTFTATVANGGTAPIYQWQVNGADAGVNSPGFTTATLNEGDQVRCIVTSNASCTTSATAVSNTATFNLQPPISTFIKITSSEPGPFCAGTEVTFTATAYTPDVHPFYQWQINGANAGSNNAVFTTSTLRDGDIVTCVLTSQGNCLIDSVITSNAITAVLNPASQCIVVIPNTFTPNGDGINDFWDISALVSYPSCTVDIYNRYGVLVFRSVGYPRPWDGTSGGKSLPIGTYYYIIDLNNGKKPYDGSVTIIR